MFIFPGMSQYYLCHTRTYTALPGKTEISSYYIMVTLCVFEQSQANCYQETDLKAILEIKTPKNEQF